MPVLSKRAPAWLYLILSAAVFAAFGNGLFGVFHFDDIPRILNNTQLLTLHTAVRHSSRPLTDASFYVNIHLWGTTPLPFHIVNILIHTLSALCLFDLLLIILQRPTVRASSPIAARWMAFATSLVWALHPTHTEAVTYIVQRAELLATFFSVVAVWTFFKSLASARAAPLLFTSLLAALAAMLSKPVAGVLPLLILLLDSTLVANSVHSAWRTRKAYYGVLGLLLVGLTLLLTAPNESNTSAGFTSAILSPLDYWLNQQKIVWHYLRLWFHPVGLCLDYIRLPEPRSAVCAFVALNVLVGLGIVVGVIRRWPLAIALAAAVLLWLPSSSVVPIADLVAERRMYMPAIPLCLACVMLAEYLLQGFLTSPRLATVTRTVLLGTLAAFLTLQTNQRNLDYCSRSRMQRDILTTSPHNMRARIMLMTALTEEGKLDQAYTAGVAATDWIRTVRHEVPPNPVFLHLATVYEASVLHNIGRVLILQGEYSLAANALNRAIMAQADDRIAYCNLAAARYLQGYYDAAIQAAEHAIRIDPTYIKPRTIISLCYTAQNRPDLAQDMFAKIRALASPQAADASANSLTAPDADTP